MANVSKHPLFDAYLHEVELKHPELRADEIVEGLMVSFKYDHFPDEEFDEASGAYFIPQESILLFYYKREPVGKPTEVLLLRVHVRPEYLS